MKTKLFLAASLLLLSVNLLAQTSGTCGANLTWTLSNGTLTISGTGDMTNYPYFNSSPWYSCSIKSVDIKNGVTSIGDYAFFYCSSLTSVTIPNSVTSIGSDAFSRCTGLTSVTIPNSVTIIGGDAFSGCTGLTSVTIPNSVTSIGSYAFYGCTGLTQPIYNSHIFVFMPTSYSGAYTIPSGIESIAEGAFYGRSSLTNVTIPNSVTSIGSSAFYGCNSLTNVTIPNSVTSIGSSAFSRCTDLTSVTIPNSVTSIGDCAFEYCISLTSVTIPNSVTGIGDRAFFNCSSLIMVFLHNIIQLQLGEDVFNISESIYNNGQINPNCTFYLHSQTKLDKSIFEGCKEIVYYDEIIDDYIFKNDLSSWNLFKYIGTDYTNLSLPKSVNGASYSIAEAIFYNFDIETITIPAGVKTIEDNAFGSCKYLKSVTFEDGVTTIEGGAFANCNSLTSITLPNSLTTLGDKSCTYNNYSYSSSCFGVFEGCYNLKNVNLGNSLKEIGSRCFVGCPIETISLPNSLETIGSQAFSNTSLKSVTWGTGLREIGNGAFANCKFESVSIPNSVTTIGDGYDSYYSTSAGVFEGCENLSSVSLGKNMTKIGSRMFYNCSSLEKVDIPGNIQTIGNSAFYNCGSLRQINIPNGLKYIESSTFENCPNITELTLPNTLKRIGSKAFQNCIGLTNVVIPNSVDSIESNAFSGLADMETMTLGKSIKYLASNAFGDCKRITDIYCYAERIPDVYGDPFKNVSRKAYLWVPENRVRNYKIDSFWGEFDVQAMSAESANTDKVVVTPDYNTASIAWPQVTNVDSYELVIKDKNGNEVCTLVFNSEGQLQSIAFRAPKMNMGEEAGFAPKQTQATGFRFTVTGLDSGSRYDYTLTAKDAAGKTLQTYTGSFYTLGTTGLDDLDTNDPASMSHARKIIEDGKVFILLPDGRRFTLQGAEVK